LKVINDKTSTAEQWLESLQAGTDALLTLASKPEDVDNIFKVNRSTFDKAKELDPVFYGELVASFNKTKKSFK
jgi:hypothetical protein